jgi:hypothetical protein
MVGGSGGQPLDPGVRAGGSDCQPGSGPSGPRGAAHSDPVAPTPGATGSGSDHRGESAWADPA